MRLSRRTVLAAPLAFGLDALTGCGGAAEDALEAGLARMRETGRFGLVLVAPADEAQARKLGRDLHRLLGTGPAEARELACSVVLIGLPRDLARRRIRADLPAHPVFLLSPEGKLVDSAFYDPASDAFEQVRGAGTDPGPANLLRLLRSTVFDGESLVLERASKKLELSVDEKNALAALEGERWEDAAAFLRPRAERLGPLLALRARASEEPLCGRIRSVFNPTPNAAPKLPYGMTVEQGPVEVEDPCAWCGLGGPIRTTVNGTFFKFMPG